MLTILQHAMTLDEVLVLAHEQEDIGRVTFIIEVTFADLLDLNLRQLNELLDIIAVVNFEWIPTDIRYHVIGVIPDGMRHGIVTGDILLEVNCFPKPTD